MKLCRKSTESASLIRLTSVHGQDVRNTVRVDVVDKLCGIYAHQVSLDQVGLELPNGGSVSPTQGEKHTGSPTGHAVVRPIAVQVTLTKTV